MNYLSSITWSFLPACKTSVRAARSDADNIGGRNVGEYTDIRLEWAGR